MNASSMCVPSICDKLDYCCRWVRDDLPSISGKELVSEEEAIIGHSLAPIIANIARTQWLALLR